MGGTRRGGGEFLHVQRVLVCVAVYAITYLHMRSHSVPFSAGSRFPELVLSSVFLLWVTGREGSVGLSGSGLKWVGRMEACG